MATTYYISPSGLDSNPGTSALTPWKTIAFVNSQPFLPGDSILFEGGQNFPGTLSFSGTNCGTAAAPLTLSSYGTGRATIQAGTGNGIEVMNCAGFNIHALNVLGAGRALNDNHGILFYSILNSTQAYDYISIHEVEVSGFNRGGITILSDPVFSDSGYRNIEITHAVLHDNGDYGIGVLGKVLPTGHPHHNIYIAHCMAYDNPGQIGKNTAHTGNGIVVGNTDGVIIEYCQAYNNGAENYYNGGGPVGIWIWDSHKGVIQFCESHHNKTGSTKDGGGFDLDGGCTESVIQYCYSHDNDGAGFLLAEYNGARPLRNNTLRYNISQNDARNNDYGGIHFWKGSGILSDVKIYNNVIFMSSGPGITPAAFRSVSAGIDSVLVANNLFITSGNIDLVDKSSNSADIDFRGNAYYSMTGQYRYAEGANQYNNLAAWRTGKGQEMLSGNPVGFEGNPEVSNPGGGGTVGDPTLLFTLNAYNLLSASPLKDTGLELNTVFGLNVGSQDFFNNSIPSNGQFDVGAEESAGSLLPLLYDRFYATRLTDETVVIEWQLADESGVDSVTVERRLEGEFLTEKIVVLPEIPGPQSWYDANNFSARSYYRLVFRNPDGKFSFSPYLEVEGRPDVSTAVEIFPQPFKDQFLLKITGDPGEEYQIELLDMQGRKIRSWQDKTGDSPYIEIDALTNLPTGGYILRVLFQDKTYCRKLLKE
ncbi:MAG: right-handed parallel beta-helix repeat-containing protein [Bacteroidia bacterium]|nr:right-handed parallel beta-helix repeat-containing protein [Bacteroidia bacterium]